MLAARYRLLAVCGQGGMGTTYRARDASTEQVVAVKELPIRPGSPAKHTELFEREARVLKQLDHPGIPRYVDHFGAGRGKHRARYLVQAFIDGGDLQASLETRRYAVRDVLELLRALLPTLIYLHELSPPVLHRDIKPRNVILSSEAGAPCLVDFGSVRDVLVDDDLGGSTVAGTFGFMAPEQFMGVATPATDLYGLGATAVALLARKPLHTLLDTNRALQWRRHVHVSEPVAALLRDLLASDPAARPPSARAVLSRVEGLLDSDAPEAPPALRSPPVPVPAGEAVRAVDVARAPTGLGPVLLGAPTEISIERTVPGRVGPAHHVRVTSVIESTMGAPGRVEVVGELYRWATSQGHRRMVRVSVADLGDGTTRIHVWERLSGHAGGLYGGLVGGVGGGIGGGGTGPVAVLLGPLAGVLWLVGAVGAGFLLARVGLRYAYRTRTAQLEAAIEALAAVIAPP